MRAFPSLGALGAEGQGRGVEARDPCDLYGLTGDATRAIEKPSARPQWEPGGAA